MSTVVAVVVVIVVSIGVGDNVVAAICLGLSVVVGVSVADATVVAFSVLPVFSVVTVSFVAEAEVATLCSFPGMIDVVRSSPVVAGFDVCRFIVSVMSVIEGVVGRVSVDFTFVFKRVEVDGAVFTLIVTFL